ncbi:MAG TPA: glycosyltransferase [Candidatus Wujingus californicus]|nr:glycosyltransferase family 2 protein [Planctomycetota bacterium]
MPHARNYGISKAAGNIIIFCDDDVIIPSQFY